MFFSLFRFKALILIYVLNTVTHCYSNDILGCGGFVKSHASIDFSKIEIGLYTKEGSLKERTECAPTNGYYFLPLYEKGEYILKVHPPAGWSFEPSEVELLIDGETDQCSTGEDINFVFNGFGITGQVITAGQKQGPSGINIQLVNEKGDVRNTITTVGGDFHFTPVIPGKYIVKASHPRWKLDPAQTVVQVKEGNTVLPHGSLSVKGYDVTGSVTSFGSPIAGITILLYSIQENPKFRVEGCVTALLQGVPDSPICYSATNTAGEFKFGLVPAGDYKLLALAKSPGQATITYNIKPDTVPFTVKHDSLYIKNAFEITGFSALGTVMASSGGSGISGARVLLGGEPVGSTDAAGKFTLSGLEPGTFALNLQHEQCEFDELQVVVTASGVTTPLRAVAARWKVCGELSPPEPRSVVLRATDRKAPEQRVQAAADGKWCTFLQPGVYAAAVEVSEQEQRDGLQFYPEEQRVSVGHAPVRGVTFSQVRARVRGRVLCGAYCAGLRVALRPLAADGNYAGPPRHAPVVDGSYSFEEVVPGSVEVSVPAQRLCWAEAAHNVAVTQELPPVPDFELHGLALQVSATHRMQLEYKSSTANGVLTVPAGQSRQCVPLADQYTLVPRGCHRVEPSEVIVDMNTGDMPSVSFVAVAHAAVIKILSPEPASDVVLQLRTAARPDQLVPLQPTPVEEGGEYEHTIYLAEGEVVTVVPQSSRLLFSPRGPQRLVGGPQCRSDALTLRAYKALTLSGRIVPPVAGVLVTLEGGEDENLTQTTGEDGAYSFGPLDAAVRYTVTAEKDSYVFGQPDHNGDIAAHKLAEITVQLVDAVTEAPLEGALVSVSGGSFRRNVASGSTGWLRFGALSPAQYYVKPNMKEYRFEPPHSIVPVGDGRTHQLLFKGVRVAWSAHGRCVSLGGVGVARVQVRARAHVEHAARCPQQDATTSPTGDFRIRGLLPNCEYTLELKESTDPELMNMELAKAPPPILVNEKDISDIRLIVIQINQYTDSTMLIRTPIVEHYKTLRYSLLADGPYSEQHAGRLDAAGCSAHNNPGVMIALPRLPANNNTYVLRVDSNLSKMTYEYDDQVFYFVSDGKFKHFDVEFLPKVKSSEQELRQSSLLVLPLLGALALLYSQRHRLPTLRSDGKKAPRKKTQ